MDRRQIEQSGQRRDGRQGMEHAAWISGRIETLLSHYYQPDSPSEVRDGAIDDWVEILCHLSRPAIEMACAAWLRDHPRRRPTPGDIRAKASTAAPTALGDRSRLSHDELILLEEKVLQTARRWVRTYPGIADHGRQTLAFWGEEA